MKKSILKALVLLLTTLLLAGCWDYTEIESLGFVFGAGVEQVEPDFVVYLEMIDSVGGGQETQFTPKVLTSKGRGFSSAGRALSNVAGTFVFWPHTSVFLVSEEVARQGALPAIEYILRNRRARSTIYILVTKDCTVEEVFKSKPLLANSVSDHLDGIFALQPILAKFYPVQIWEFVGNLTARGISVTAPTVQLVHESGELVPIVEGTAVFKEDRMVGWLDAEESQLFCILKGESQRPYVVMDTKTKEGIFPITYEMIGSNAEIKPTTKDGEPTIDISVELRFNVTEIGDAQINFQDPKEVAAIEDQVAHTFNRRIKDFFRKLQVEYNSDILGFGRLLRRKEPQIWRRYEDVWDSYYPQLAINVEVKVFIELTGLFSKSIVVRD
ncbi:MAG: Ger(x)C family spore germination protein [Firmicutes bacterium]|nr:Ger(x)C family spore germination protein [Bacillota bacterium]